MNARKRRGWTLSEDDKIDWDKVLNQPDVPKPEVSKAQLWVQLERMKQAADALPRWRYFKMFVVVIDIIAFVGLSGFLISQPRIPYIGALLVLIIIQLLILTDFFLTMFRLTRQARGEK